AAWSAAAREPPARRAGDSLPAVHGGYSSAQPEQVIRRELCEEAIRLGRLLDEHPMGAVPETAALVALMYLNAARFDSRVDGAGGLLVLEEQDRSLWDRE